MTPTTPTSNEALHLLFLRALVYTGAVLVFVIPLASLAGILAATTAVPLGIFLSCRLAPSRLRLPVLGMALATVLGLGFLLAQILGNTVWMVDLLGIGPTMAVLQVLTWGLGTFGVVFGLRLLAMRFPALALLEVAAVAGIVVFLFAGHRDYQIDQPRSLSDWAFSRGHDPLGILLIIGVVTLGGLALLLFQKQRPVKTLAALVVLMILGLFCYLWAHQDAEENTWERKQVAQKGQKKHNGQQGQSGGQGNGSSGGTSGQNGPWDEDPTRDPNTFKPTENPNEKGTPLAIVTLHEDFQPVEQGYYFRARAYSQFNGRRLVKADFPGADLDVQTSFPKQLLKVQDTVLAVDIPVFGKTLLFKSVPTTVTLIVGLTRPFAHGQPLTFEPRPNPDPTRFRRAYAVTSRVLINPKITAYELTEQTLSNLRTAGVPAAALAKLRAIVQRKVYFPEESWFRTNLKAVLAKDEAGRYEDTIVKHARITFTVDVNQVFRDLPAGDPRWPEALREHYLTLPPDPRYKELSDKIVQEVIIPQWRKSALLRARAIQQWFWKNTIYSKTADHQTASDPTASYLFGDRRGKCVHIAHAMTLLLRSQGLPARVVGGYMVPAKRRGLGSTILLQTTDAHSWCEMYLQGIGWINMDTFSERSEDPPPPEPSKEFQLQLGDLARQDKTADEIEAGKPFLTWAMLLWLLPLAGATVLSL
jgi:hypothetical protein